MTHAGSYQVGSFASSTDAEIRRLNAQVDLFWPGEGEILLRNGLKDGMRVVDCGCGPGRLIERMKRLLPGLECVGVEIDPVLVEAASKHLLECKLDNCSVQQGSAESPGLPTESYDFVVTRLVMEHVPDVGLALRSLQSLLKPGGRLAVISNDFDFHLRTAPAVPELDQLYEAYCASRRHDQGDPCIGRRMPHLLLEAGFSLVGCEIELAHNAMIGDGPFLRAEGAGIPAQLVRSGFLQESTMENMTRTWREMLVATPHSIARPLWIAVGERREPGTEDQRLASSAEDDVTDASVAEGANVLEVVLGMIAKATKNDDVSADDSLANLGVDSLTAMQLQDRVKALTGVELPVVRFFADIPVKELVAGLEIRKGGAKPAEKTEAADEKDWEEGEI